MARAVAGRARKPRRGGVGLSWSRLSGRSVQFRTTPLDSTGVPHVLEHTVLCGSRKYPCRDPFFKMLNRSLSTFMNAFTGRRVSSLGVHGASPGRGVASPPWASADSLAQRRGARGLEGAGRVAVLEPGSWGRALQAAPSVLPWGAGMGRGGVWVGDAGQLLR